MIEIVWRRRPIPLTPSAVLGFGQARRLLAGRLLEALSAGADLQVHAGTDCLLVVGNEADLPWVDGAIWLGREAGLFVPTTAGFEPHVDLIGRAVRRRVGTDVGWIALLPGRLLVGHNPVGLPDRDRLRAIAGGAD